MKIKTDIQGELQECDYLVIYENNCEFRISKEMNGKLSINKISHDSTDTININPVCSNKVKIS